MELSCKTEYALLALLELAQHHNDGQVLQIKEIAAHQSIPDRYLEQLLATLRRQGLVRSQRGAKGGYSLARAPWMISLLDVIQAIEGEDLTRSRDLPTADPTPEREVLLKAWQDAQAAAVAILQKTTLQDLCDQQAQQQRANLMYYI
ncbi:Rrf2 family transcriptional regulator [Synechococcus sp. Nb3U1]|uniref:RrF2 family transcriptional regulator n=1 Tax=Synechococcus sp. Nb3U1 TaxID=1914529 RepID=UPI001F3357D1|nr:Rrf2 family transcriptional regulator [Synechococcus sp. Nb3U1]MCF2971325.1 Rrf2 family transcriptional regulator [Synechococcus sp. Nb3U1]